MMNERIQELIEQASKQVSVTIPASNPAYAELARLFAQQGNLVLNTFQQKFAELMIKKFDGILLLEYIDCVGEQDKQAADRIARLRGKVETYFGVEE